MIIEIRNPKDKLTIRFDSWRENSCSERSPEESARYNTERQRNGKYKRLRCMKDRVRFNKYLIKIQEGDNRENGGRQYSKK